MTSITESDLRAWLIDWERSLNTEAAYHGLIYGVLADAVKCRYLAVNPAVGTAPNQSRVRQPRPELRFLPERELVTVARIVRRPAAGCGRHRSAVRRISAQWVTDVDLNWRSPRILAASFGNGLRLTDS